MSIVALRVFPVLSLLAFVVRRLHRPGEAEAHHAATAVHLRVVLPELEHGELARELGRPTNMFRVVLSELKHAELARDLGRPKEAY